MKIKKLLLYLATWSNLTKKKTSGDQKKPHTIKYIVYDSIHINKKQYKTSISHNKSLGRNGNLEAQKGNYQHSSPKEFTLW